MSADGEDPLARRVGDAETVREVFEEMPILLMSYEGPEYTVLAVNERYRSLLGRSEIVGVPLAEAMPELAGQAIFEMFDRVYATGQTQVGREWRVQVIHEDTGQPQEAFLDFTLTPVAGPDGRPPRLLAYATDVTERVRERQAAEQHAAEAEQRYEAARDVVAELQAALLPTGLPVLPGARIAGRYLVAAQDQAAGGDWFDAVALADGTVALVAGDVVGHGVTASAAMGQLRAVLTERLAAGADLETVLAQLDSFAASAASTRAATLAVAVLDPATGWVRYSTCGHPEPLIVAADGATRFLSGTGNGPLGTGSTPQLATDTLAPGELVLLYSDGLIERPGRTLDAGKAELAQVAGDAAANRVLPLGAAPTPAERVCQLTVELLTRTGYADDITTLAAQRLPTPVEPLVLDLSSGPAGLAQVRRAFAEWLDELGPIEDDRIALELAVGEIVTNAAEHAYPAEEPGSVRFEAALLADGQLQVQVADQGRWRAPDPAETIRGRGLLLAEQLLDQLRVSHPPQDPADPPGARGTTVTLHHRPHRPAMLASDTSVTPATHPDRPAFAVDTDPSGPEPYTRVTGPVDITTIDRFTRELIAASRSGVLPLTVDLSAVTLLASAGVRALHELRDQLAAHQQTLTLVSEPDTPAHTVLNLVGLAHTTATSRHDMPANAG